MTLPRPDSMRSFLKGSIVTVSMWVFPFFATCYLPTMYLLLGDYGYSLCTVLLGKATHLEAFREFLFRDPYTLCYDECVGEAK